MKILVIGDIVGKGGRRAVATLAPALRQEYGCTFCIVNGENMAGGGGITAACLNDLWINRSVDVVTSGDHIWDQKETVAEIRDMPNVLRPANLALQQPGRGWGVYKTTDGTPVGVINLLGRVFMHLQSDCPFRAADRALEEIAPRAKLIFVDIHAEATSEKIAMGRYLDGRVTAVFGTHTHVQTADEQVFPGGTGFICDVGMVGAKESILGRAITPVLQRFVTGMPAQFKVVEHGTRLHGIVVEVDPRSGKTLSITRVVRDLPDGSL